MCRSGGSFATLVVLRSSTVVIEATQNFVSYPIVGDGLENGRLTLITSTEASFSTQLCFTILLLL